MIGPTLVKPSCTPPSHPHLRNPDDKDHAEPCAHASRSRNQRLENKTHNTGKQSQKPEREPKPINRKQHT